MVDMGQIVVMKDGVIERVHPIGRTNVTVGRLEYNDLVIDHPSISRAHVRVGFDGAGWFVEDLGSTNGTYLNDNQVERDALHWGDRVQAGEYTLHFLPDEDASGRTTAALKTVEELIGLSAQFFELLEPTEVLEKMVERLIEIFRAERGFVLLANEAGELEPAITRYIDPDGDESEISKTIAGDVFSEGRPLLITDALAEVRFKQVESIERGQIRSIVCVPLPGLDNPLGVLYLDSRVSARTFTSQDLELLNVYADYGARAIQSAEHRTKLSRNVQALKTLQDEGCKREHDYDHIIGDTEAMKELLERVTDIAQSDIATLILGESGTGKELIARAIHHRSTRKNEPFVAVNCMAFSDGVIASELFGHEKGAFTGATSRRRGRCELADGGTLFLDEIGELAPEVQVKLLRFLQEQTFERVGGSETIKVNVRLIAATNCDIEARVADGSFREDLFYRINAFTVVVPPLRERREDIILIAKHYGATFAAKMGRPFGGLADEARKALLDYHWPGNVRELRNVMERAIVLTRKGAVSAESLPFTVGPGAAAPQGAFDLTCLPLDFHKAKEIFEKTFLVEALKRNSGHIAKTAREVGLPRKTIYRKMETYDISRDGEES